MTSCIEWTKCKDGNGYGMKCVKEDGKWRTRRVHRLEWSKHYGVIPTDLVVRHKCDNPACYNIDHLELGTKADNNKDRSERGRTAKLFGESNSQSVLKPSDILEIRSKILTMTSRDLGAEYGVSKTQILRIANGKSWSHI